MLMLGYYGLLPECDRHLARLFRTVREKAGCSVLLDTAGAPPKGLRLPRTFLPYVDYFLPSLDEATQITGERTPGRIVAVLRAAGARGVLGVKMGRDGSYIDCNNMARWVPPLKVRRVVDATGAGDAFIAGFLAATLKGYDPFEAGTFGNAVAAQCITAVGASTAIRRFSSYVRGRPRVQKPRAEEHA
jgi:sugar/nucleoside kinase (ribokinase family)